MDKLQPAQLMTNFAYNIVIVAGLVGAVAYKGWHGGEYKGRIYMCVVC